MPAQNNKPGGPLTATSTAESTADDFAELFQKVEFPITGELGGMHEMALPSGRRLSVREERDSELITICNPHGEVEVSIRLTPAGPVLNVQAAAINLQTPGEMTIDCGQLTVRAQGDVVEEIGGQKSARVEGKASLEAHTIDVKSRRGNITAKANDDVCLLGERIKLNS